MSRILSILCVLVSTTCIQLYSADAAPDWFDGAVTAGLITARETSAQAITATGGAISALPPHARGWDTSLDTLITHLNAAGAHGKVMAARVQFESHLLTLNPDSDAVRLYNKAQWYLKRLSSEHSSPHAYTSEHWSAAVTLLLHAHRNGHPNARFQLALLLLEGHYADGATLFSGALADDAEFELLEAADGSAVQRLSATRATALGRQHLTALHTRGHPFANFVLTILTASEAWLEEKTRDIELPAVTAAIRKRMACDRRSALAHYMPQRPYPPETTKAPTLPEEGAE